MSLLLKLRQIKFHKEFRISPFAWPNDISITMEKLIAEFKNVQQLDFGTSSISEKDENQFLSSIATGLWRLKQKMIKSGTDEPLKEMSRAYRHFESIWDTMIQAGVQVKDHTDDLFDSGMSIKVIAFQPIPELTREKIIETIKPSIYFSEKCIQMGEVIVGTPEN